MHEVPHYICRPKRLEQIPHGAGKMVSQKVNKETEQLRAISFIRIATTAGSHSILSF